MERLEGGGRSKEQIVRAVTGTDYSKVGQDIELVKLCAKGDVDAYAELVSRHQRAVYGIVSRMVQRRDDVDDLVQDVFVLAYRSIGSFRGDSSFSTWLGAIAVNTTLKYMKRAKNRQALSIDDPETALGEVLAAGGPSPEDAVQARARDAAVRKAIDSLPDKQRAVVILHYFEDCTCEEIAKMLRCSVGTVWSRLHYACKKLRGQLDWLGS
ncbi:MAG: sigma-70 family RNA polymerase sigma factor [Armatimonadota bacterium]|nr:sigma-70 family RNA polymerase sigma factor [Armatimonadota bacterium]